ncbi:MAG: SDR family oxidoreductase [Protaetiibacter sp.]
MDRLAGKVAVVTGVGPGIGNAIPRAFAREGADLVLVSRGGAALERTASEVEALGRRAVAVIGDVAEEDTWRRADEAAMAAFGGVDVVVNSAATGHFGNILEITLEEWHEALEVNLTGAFHSFRTFIPRMAARGGGSFVNVTSINSIIANPRIVDYATSKGGLNALTRNMALDFGLQGIRFNAIAPGAIFTPEAEAELDELERETIRDGYPIDRWGVPDDIAHAAVYLASDEASFVTGVVLPVDGGLTIVTPEASTRTSFRARWRPGTVRIHHD